MKVTDFGAILVSLMVPDENHKLRDVVLGYDTVEGYYVNPPHFGSPIGRMVTVLEMLLLQLMV